MNSLDPDGSGGGSAYAITHDKAGNIRERVYSIAGPITTSYIYTHDAWNRLVRVEVLVDDSEVEEDPPNLTAIYEAQYNGLSWRVVKRADTSAPVVNGLDEMRVMIYSAGWQMLEERVDTGWSSGFTADKIYQTIYGLRYIDDVICRRLDHDVDGSYTDEGSKTFYHLTDNQFSTVAVLDDVGGLVERVSYDPYGRARHHWMADVDGDGDQDSGDITAVYNLGPGYMGAGINSITGVDYNVEADLDRDGDIDTADYSIASGDGTRTALGSGTLSSSGVGNTLDFSGHIFNAGVGVGISEGPVARASREKGGKGPIFARPVVAGSWGGRAGTLSRSLTPETAILCDPTGWIAVDSLYDNRSAGAKLILTPGRTPDHHRLE